jgi:DNA-binding NarL/FixJ family response regulator
MNTKITIETLTLLKQNLTGTDIAQPLTLLQEREIELLCHMINEPSNEALGDKMCITTKSVENYKTRIGDKLCLRGHHALFRFVLKNRKFFRKLASIFITSAKRAEKQETKLRGFPYMD